MRIITLFLISFLIAFPLPRNIFAATATSSAQAIEEVVQKKISSIKNSPRAYVGTVTDKSQNTLQIKTEKGEIKLISVDTNRLSVTKVATKTTAAKFDDIAIGDFIISMGIKNGNDILNSTKILITPAFDEPKRKIISATITKIIKKEVTVESGTNIYTLKFPKKWQGPDIKDLREGDKIIIVGEVESNTITLRSIFKN